jgi:hypothetical protein
MAILYRRMYGEMRELLIYHHSTTELPISKSGEEVASESKERAEDEDGAETQMPSPFQLRALNRFHEINRPSSVKWLSTAHSLLQREPLVGN